MRVVLATVGSRGDVQPMIALALALIRAGHQPIVAAPPNFAGWIQSLKIAFAPLGQDMQAWLAANNQVLTSNPLSMMQGMTRYFGEHLPAQFTELLATTEGAGASAIVCAGIAFAAPSVAEKLSIPCLTVAYSTSILPSSVHPPPTIPWQGLPAWMNDLLWRASNFASDAIAGKAFNAGRAAIGLPPVRQLTAHLYGSQSIYIAVDASLFPPDPAWRGRYRYSGFIYYDPPAVLDPALDAWLADGEPPIFIGFGSMSGGSVDRMSAILEDAVVGSGRRCLVGAGWGGLGGRALPSGWRMVKEAPHALLFPRTAVVVHHGGAGTTANALRAGVPQVILPLILDQFHHAHYLHALGLAASPTSMEDVTASQLAAAIHEALRLPVAPRRSVAERLRRSDGAGQIVRELEALVSARAGSP